MASSTVNDDDSLLVPCEWSDGTVTQRRVRKGEAFLHIIAQVGDRRRHTQLTRIGAELGRATWFTRLHLQDHRLDSLPDEMRAMTGLQTLHLKDNAFRRVPACVPRLAGLQSLYLGNNPLEELPDEIGNLRALTSLTVPDCPRLAWLPSSFARLTRLKSLMFDEETIAWLPSTMRSMPQLQRLDTTKALDIGRAAASAKLNRLLDNCHERERSFLTEFALGFASLNLPVLLMTLIWERVHGARMPDAAGWFVSEQRRWLVFDAVHKAATAGTREQ